MSMLEFDPWIRLNYAREVTERMNDSSDLIEMITVFANSINFEINKDKKYRVDCGRACDYTYDGCYIYFDLPGGIEEKYKLEYLIAELVVAYMYPAPSPSEKKRRDRPSFAFLVAGLSTLETDDRIDENIRQIVRSAYNLALDLATAAIAASHADTLRDMERGIRAVKERKNSSNFSQHVFACLMAHRHLIETGCTNPTKGLVRDGAKKILNELNILISDDSARWREFFAVAGFKDLPQERPGRGKKIL